MKKPEISVDVVSDVVCPWCYIGKRRLEKAIDQVKDKYDIRVRYLPFELNPGMPEEGRDQKAYLVEKFGGEERYRQLTARVTGVAGEEGLSFDFSKQSVSPNTRKSHRIIWLAGKEGRQHEVKEALMSAYFEKGINLSDDENLIRIAKEQGLDEGKVRHLLASGEGESEVEQAERLSVQRGVTGVPFYIINGKYGVSGAQSPATFVQVLDEVGGAAVTEGESCDVDEKNC